MRMYLTVGLLQAHTYHTDHTTIPTIPPYRHTTICIIPTLFRTLMRIDEFPAILCHPTPESFIHPPACRGYDRGSRISMLILTSVTLSLIAAVS